MQRREWMRSLLPILGLTWAASQSACSDVSADKVDQKKSQATEADCTDLSGLSDDDRKARESLGYEPAATDPERRCSGCALFVPAKQGACAGCMLFKGPVFPEGSCIQFQPRPV